MWKTTLLPALDMNRSKREHNPTHTDETFSLCTVRKSQDSQRKPQVQNSANRDSKASDSSSHPYQLFNEATVQHTATTKRNVLFKILAKYIKNG